MWVGQSVKSTTSPPPPPPLGPLHPQVVRKAYSPPGEVVVLEGIAGGEAVSVLKCRSYAVFRRSVETFVAAQCTSMVYILLTLWRTLYGTTYGALKAPRRAPCSRETCEALARSLKMKVDSTAYLDAGMGPSFPMWTGSQDAKSVTTVLSVGEGAKNSTGSCRSELCTSSADEAFQSSF